MCCASRIASGKGTQSKFCITARPDNACICTAVRADAKHAEDPRTLANSQVAAWWATLVLVETGFSLGKGLDYYPGIEWQP